MGSYRKFRFMLPTLPIIKSFICCLIGCLLFTVLLAAPAAAEPDDLARSVVKIFAVFRKPNYYQPWDEGYQENLTGSGAILEGRRILTNAHVVSNQVYLQVRKAGDPTKYTARVQFVSHDRELALLTVEDPKFFEGTVPVTLGALVHPRDRVAAYGFPTGGDDLSITEGVVSRIEVITYTHSRRSLLAIQTDAAINPGNSGGPLFKDGKLIGASFQSYSGSGVENVGYVVPIPVIETFFRDIADGGVDGVPALGIYAERLENQAMRAWLKMPPGQTGALVSRVQHGGAADGVLQPDDVLLAIDGNPIGNDATIPFPEDGSRKRNARVSFSYAVTQRQVGDEVKLDILRAGERHSVRVKLRPPAGLVRGPEYDVRPQYRLFAGLLFMPLTANYVGLWEKKDVNPKYRFFQTFDWTTPQRKQIVLVTQVLAHDVNVGYHDVQGAVVERVNGRPITEMKDLGPALAAPQGGYHVIELADYPDFGDRIVLDAAKVEAATAEILARYRIPAAASQEPATAAK